MDAERIPLAVTVGAVALFFVLEWVFPYYGGRRKRFRHAWPNVIIAILGGIVSSLFFAYLIVRAMRYMDARSAGLLPMIGGPAWFGLIASFVFLDVWTYAWHIAVHKSLFLWRFHRAHHSDLEMDSTTAFRFHPGEILFSSTLRLAVLPLLGITVLQLIVYETCLQGSIFFHHRNVSLPERYDRILRALLVTPNMHRIHHSQVWSETNSNFTSVLSIWDRLFRTFRMRDTHEVELGLRTLQQPEWQGLRGLLRTPFKSYARRKK